MAAGAQSRSLTTPSADQSGLTTEMAATPADAQPPVRREDEERIADELGVATTDPFAAAVRATRMPIVVSNPRAADNPVVFANDAFCRLTGYAREEIIGRNCRFLQGPRTDPDTISRIRSAVAESRPLEIDIRNHRKTGEPFWNRLLMAPVHDARGKLAWFVASQVDVTGERERLAGLESDNAAIGNGAALEPGMEIMTKPFALAALAGKVRAMIEDRAESL